MAWKRRSFSAEFKAEGEPLCKVGKGWLYVAMLLDLPSPGVAGWATSVEPIIQKRGVSSLGREPPRWFQRSWILGRADGVSVEG
jgi:hypothetical protein